MEASLLHNTKTINTEFALIACLPHGIDEEEVKLALAGCQVDIKTILGVVFVDLLNEPGAVPQRKAYVWLRSPQEVEWLVVRAHGMRPWIQHKDATCLSDIAVRLHLTLSPRHGRVWSAWDPNAHHPRLHVEPVSAAEWVNNVGKGAVHFHGLEKFLCWSTSIFDRWQAFLQRLPAQIAYTEEDMAEVQHNQRLGAERVNQIAARYHYNLLRMRDIAAAAGLLHSSLRASSAAGHRSPKLNTVYLGGLPPTVNDYAIRRLLSVRGLGQSYIEFVRIFPARSGFATAYAIVRFTATAYAITAVRKLDNHHFGKFTPDGSFPVRLAQMRPGEEKQNYQDPHEAELFSDVHLEVKFADNAYQGKDCGPSLDGKRKCIRAGATHSRAQLGASFADDGWQQSDSSSNPQGSVGVPAEAELACSSPPHAASMERYADQLVEEWQHAERRRLEEELQAQEEGRHADEIFEEHERATNRRLGAELQQELEAQESARHADEIFQVQERATNQQLEEELSSMIEESGDEKRIAAVMPATQPDDKVGAAAPVIADGSDKGDGTSALIASIHGRTGPLLEDTRALCTDVAQLKELVSTAAQQARYDHPTFGPGFYLVGERMNTYREVQQRAKNLALRVEEHVGAFRSSFQGLCIGKVVYCGRKVHLLRVIAAKRKGQSNMQTWAACLSHVRNNSTTAKPGRAKKGTALYTEAKRMLQQQANSKAAGSSGRQQPRTSSLTQLMLWLRGLRRSVTNLRTMRLDKHMTGWFMPDDQEKNNLLTKLLVVEAALEKGFTAGAGFAEALSLVCKCDARNTDDPWYCTLGVEGYKPTPSEASCWQGSRESEVLLLEEIGSDADLVPAVQVPTDEGSSSRPQLRRRIRGKQTPSGSASGLPVEKKQRGSE